VRIRIIFPSNEKLTLSFIVCYSEYVKAYSLPLCFAKLFGNMSYLEYGARGSFPEPPEMGYRAGRGDIGELCCPCFCPRENSLRDDDDEEMEANV
jgi:hypothetical protein